MIPELRSNLIELYVGLQSTEATKDYLPMVVFDEKLFYRHSWRGASTYTLIELPADYFHGICAKWLHQSKESRLGHYFFNTYQRYHQSVQNWKNFVTPPKKSDKETYLIIELFHFAHREYFKSVSHWEKLIRSGLETERTFSQIKVDEVVSKTLTTLFNECFHETMQCYQQYVHHWLQRLGKAETVPLSEEKIVEIRKQVIACSEATHEFWKFYLNSDKKELLERFHPILLADQVAFRSLKIARQVISFEGLIGKDIPIVELAKLGANEKFSEDEEKTLKKWIKALNGSTLSLSQFTKVLEALIEIIKKNERYTFTLDQLLLKLDEKKCVILHQEDLKHRRWREQLKTGDQVVCNGKAFTLAQELGNKVIDNHYRVFTLTDHPGVMRIAKNRVQLKIQAAKANDENWHWGIEPMVRVEMDSNGSCEIVEKLSDPLHEFQWKSSSFVLAEAELKRALVIASHLFYIQDQKAMPEGLSPQYLLFDQEEGLKSTALFKKGEFDYNALETFCLMVGKDNRHVVDFLMHVSQLVNHPVAKFYREAVEYVFRFRDSKLLSIVQDREYKRKIYDIRAEQLCQQAQGLISNCTAYVKDHLIRQENYPYKNDEQLKEEVCSRLFILYKASSTPGTLFSDRMKQQVLDSFLNGKKEFAIPYDVMNYYEQQAAEIQKNNKMVLDLEED